MPARVRADHWVRAIVRKADEPEQDAAHERTLLRLLPPGGVRPRVAHRCPEAAVGRSPSAPVRRSARPRRRAGGRLAVAAPDMFAVCRPTMEAVGARRPALGHVRRPTGPTPPSSRAGSPPRRAARGDGEAGVLASARAVAPRGATARQKCWPAWAVVLRGASARRWAARGRRGLLLRVTAQRRTEHERTLAWRRDPQRGPPVIHGAAARRAIARPRARDVRPWRRCDVTAPFPCSRSCSLADPARRTISRPPRILRPAR